MYLGEITTPEVAEIENPQEEPKNAEEPTVQSDEIQDVNEEVKDTEEEEFVDPGQFEGLKEKPKGKTAKERIDEITGKFRREEREKEILKKEKEDLLKQVEELKAKPQVQPTKQEEPIKPVVKEEIKVENSNEEIDKLWVSYEEALTELDGAQAAKIHREIDKLNNKRFGEKQNINPNEITRVLKQTEIESAARDFESTRDWINQNSQNYDPIKEGAMVSLVQNMIPKFKGPYRDLLIEAEKKVEERFNPKQARMVAPNISGINTVKKNNNIKDITLTPAQEDVAKYMFPDDKNYKEKYIELMK